MLKVFSFEKIDDHYDRMIIENEYLNYTNEAKHKIEKKIDLPICFSVLQKERNLFKLNVNRSDVGR